MIKYILSFSAAIFGIFWLTAAFASNDDSRYAISLVIRDGDKIIAEPHLITSAQKERKFAMDMGGGRKFEMRASLVNNDGKANVKWNLKLIDPRHEDIVMQENVVMDFYKDRVIVGDIPRNTFSYDKDFTITMSVDKKIVID